MGRPEEKNALKAFDEKLKQLHIGGQWQYEEMLEKSIGGPRPRGIPHIWKWAAVYPRLVEACEVLAESKTARRSLLFNNPGIPAGGSTHTLLMGIQMIKPGEEAWAHRHTMAAVRFVVQGDGKVFTTVDGEPCPMEDYDLILTPQWTWHDHRNPTGKPTIWVDALDVPLIVALNAPFYEPYPGNRVQAFKESPGEYVQSRTGQVRPSWEIQRRDNFPMRYRWKDIQSQLYALAGASGSPYDGVSLEYVNPATGGPTLPTLGCWIQMLRGGEKTRSHRHTSSAVYFVVSGEGKTIVGDQTLEWEKHDSFVVPNWAWHEHINRSKTSEAILFSVNDIPVLRALGLYREEPEISLNTLRAPPVPEGKPT